MKSHFTSVESVNNLREIQALQRLSSHAHIVKMHEVLYDKPTGRLALVFELMELNIYELIRGRREFLSTPLVQSYSHQLLSALDHMHRLGIFHRDIKPENILVSGKTLKLADFGSCRGIASKQPYTEYISTRWYRPPECLLTNGYYGHKMDIWGVGCVIFEILALFPLFPGKDEKDQLLKIHKIIGTPTPRVLRTLRSKGSKRSSVDRDIDFSAHRGKGIRKMLERMEPSCVTLIEGMLTYDEKERISASRALQSPWFDTVREKVALKSKKKKKSSSSNTSTSTSSAAAASSSSSTTTSSTTTSSTTTSSSSPTSQQKKSSKGGSSSPSRSTGAVSAALQTIGASSSSHAAAGGGGGSSGESKSSAKKEEEELARRKRKARKKRKKEKREAEKREAARRDSERREAGRREAERRDAERREAARREAARREAKRLGASQRGNAHRSGRGGAASRLPTLGGVGGGKHKSSGAAAPSTRYGVGGGSLPAASGASSYDASGRSQRRRQGGAEYEGSGRGGSDVSAAQLAAQRRLQKVRALQRRAKEEAASQPQRTRRGGNRSYVSPYSQRAISKARGT